MIGRKSALRDTSTPGRISRLHVLIWPLLVSCPLAWPTSTLAQHITATTEVAESGKLSIANTIDYAPFGYIGADGQPTGIIIELANATADLLGVKLDLQRTPFPALMPGLASGRFNIAWESFSITPERLDHVDFVVFLRGGLAASARPERLPDFAGERGICGMRVGVSAGSASDFLIDKLDHACIDKGAPDIEKVLFNTSQDIIQAVLSDRVDIRMDDATASSYFETVSSGRLVVLPTQYEVAPLGLAIKKGDTATAQMLISALTVLFENGSYEAALAQYGMQGHAVSAPYLVDSIDDLRSQ